MAKARKGLMALESEPIAASLLDDGVVEEVPLFEPLDNVVPEVIEEYNDLAALESQLQDLLYIGHDMKMSGGMCKRFAIEAQKVIPNFGGVSLEHYTEAPTATRYKLAMEELSKGIWAAIIAGVAVVLAAITKFVFWMLGRNKGGAAGGTSGGGSSSGEATEADVKQAVQKAKEMPAEVKKMSKSLDLGQQAVNKAEGLLSHNPIVLKNEHGKDYTIKSFQDIINNVLTDAERYSSAKKFLDTRNGYYHDIINGGDYSKNLSSLSRSLGAVSAALTMKADSMESVLRRDLGSHSVQDQMENNSAMGPVNKAIELTVGSRTMSLREASDYFFKNRIELLEKNEPNPIMFDKLFTTMHRAYESHTIDSIMHQSVTLMECIESVRARLRKMQDASRNLSSDGVPGALTQGMGPKIRETLSSLNEEVIAVARIQSEVAQYFSALSQLASHALGFGVEIVRKTAKLMRDQKQPIPPEWEEVLTDLHEQHEAIKGGYFSLRR